MINTLLFTIVVEGVVALVYAIWRRKPISPILLTSVLANLITQSLLWIALSLFFRDYLAILFVAEILIWLTEGGMLHGYRRNHLNVGEALFLSLLMNLSSFALGWLLPI